jgi:hypothetical protein
MSDLNFLFGEPVAFVPLPPPPSPAPVSRVQGTAPTPEPATAADLDAELQYTAMIHIEALKILDQRRQLTRLAKSLATLTGQDAPGDDPEADRLQHYVEQLAGRRQQLLARLCEADPTHELCRVPDVPKAKSLSRPCCSACRAGRACSRPVGRRRARPVAVKSLVAPECYRESPDPRLVKLLEAEHRRARARFLSGNR